MNSSTQKETLNKQSNSNKDDLSILQTANEN